VRGGEAVQRIGRAAIEHAAARDNQRALGAPQTGNRRVDIFGARRRGVKPDDARRKEIGREIPCLRLHVLGQRERNGTAQCSVGEHPQGARQRIEQLCRMHDAIEVARHWLERIVGGDAAVMEIFNLLQHRIGRARDEYVAG
jgi:hypothetical protein